MEGDMSKEADKQITCISDAVDKIISMLALMQESMDKLDMPEDKFSSKFKVDDNGFLAINKTEEK